MKLQKLKKFEFTSQGKKIILLSVIGGLLVGGIFIALAVSSSNNQGTVVTTSTNLDSFNLNKGSYSKELAIPKENVEGFDKLASLNEETQNMFLAAVGNKFCTSTSSTKSLKIKLLGDLTKENNIYSIYFLNQRDKKYYVASIYESRVVITELTKHVSGINDELYDDTEKAKTKSLRSTNEGSKVQTDTTNNIFITNTEGLEKVLPTNAAINLSEALSTWAQNEGKEIALYQSTLNPESVSNDGSITTFECLCFEKSDVNALLVEASFDSNTNQFSFAFA